MLLVCSVFTLNMDIVGVALLPLLVFIVLKTIKNRSLVNGLYSAMNMTIRAAGLLKGLMQPMRDRLYRTAIKSFIVNGVDEMKILLVNKFFFIKGGAETVYFQERNWLKAAGVDVVDFSMLHEKNFPSEYADTFVRNVDYHKESTLLGEVKTASNFIHNAEACRKMRTLLQRERPDIVHFHNIYHQLTPALIKVARNFGCKTVLTAHDYKIACPAYSMLRDGKVCDACLTGTVFNAFRYRCQEGSATKSLLLSLEATWQSIARNYHMLDVIISPSEFLKGILRRKLPHSRIDVIVNGVDDDPATDKTADKGYLLYVGRLSREKGVATLPLAHQKMRNRAPLKVVGHGPLYDELVANYPDVEFLGYVQQGGA